MELPTLYKPFTVIAIPTRILADVTYPFRRSKRQTPPKRSIIPSKKPPGYLRDVNRVQTPFAKEKTARVRKGLLIIKATPTATSRHPNTNNSNI